MRSLRTDVLFCGKDYFMRVTKFGSDQHGNNIQRQKALRALGRPFINTEAKTFLRGLPSSQMTRTTDVPTEALSKMRWCLYSIESIVERFSFARSQNEWKQQLRSKKTEDDADHDTAKVTKSFRPYPLWISVTSSPNLRFPPFNYTYPLPRHPLSYLLSPFR
jgi:hypothetical protein